MFGWRKLSSPLHLARPLVLDRLVRLVRGAEHLERVRLIEGADTLVNGSVLTVPDESADDVDPPRGRERRARDWERDELGAGVGEGRHGR